MKSGEFSLNELKSAVINRDLDKLIEFSKKEPFFSSIEEAKEIVSYINLAKKILEEERKKLNEEMNKVKNLKKYQSF